MVMVARIRLEDRCGNVTMYTFKQQMRNGNELLDYSTLFTQMDEGCRLLLIISQIKKSPLDLNDQLLKRRSAVRSCLCKCLALMDLVSCVTIDDVEHPQQS